MQVFARKLATKRAIDGVLDISKYAAASASDAVSRPVHRSVTTSAATQQQPATVDTPAVSGAPSTDHWLFAGVANPGLRSVLRSVVRRNPDQPEFLDAVHEVVTSLQPVFARHPDLLQAFEMMCEPERQIIFRVPWLDDSGTVRVNRGFRVQHSSAIGPYKGGLRFHPSVNLSIIKMLAFEQMFKNALTGLPMGAGKGGADFDPKGRSDAEIQRFCQSFVTELFRHIGDDVDVPAGDIGVGGREIGYMYGQIKRLRGGKFDGTLTGKGVPYGGSLGRPEATGYGTVLFAQELLRDRFGKGLAGTRCVVSGAGNVAGFCGLKLLELGATVLSVSDSKGTVVEAGGFSRDQLLQIQAIKMRIGGCLTDYKSPTAQYFGDRKRPWALEAVGKVDLAFPCATQNELDENDAAALAAKGCWAVFEGANMPVTAAGVARLSAADIVHVPGKQANAGGVAVIGLEMAQNRSMMHWNEEKVFDKLEAIMINLYSMSKNAAEEYGVDIGAGGNIAAFEKLADAVKSQGAV